MNVLLIGEYSGFALNLKEGLRACGANVVHIHEGDDWKSIDQTMISNLFLLIIV